MKAQRICPTCKTKSFRKSDDGLVCKYGHKVLGVQSEEADDITGVALGSRRKAAFKEKVEIQQSSPAQQRSDYLLIIQFALQVVSRSMVQDLNFPPELEPTVREFWLLYISDSKHEIIDAYMFEALEKEAEDKIKKPDNFREDIRTLEEEEVLLERMRNQNDDNDSIDSEDEELTLKNGEMRLKWPKLKFRHILSFIYLACLYLNYPLLPNDLVRWCRNGDIPYLKIQERVPPKLLSSLNFIYTQSMYRIPSPGEIRRTACKARQCYLYNCKLNIPDFNVYLYLDRFCAQFFLPVEGFYYARCILDFYRKYHLLNFQDPILVEQMPVMAYVMGSVIIAVKLMYSIGDNTPETLASVSEYDRTITKEDYMKKIRQNIEQWKNVYKQQDDLGNIIENLKDTSIASKISLILRQRNLVMLSALESIHRNKQFFGKKLDSLNSFMDTTVWDKSHHNSILTDADTIKLGGIFFSRETTIAPNEYLDILELGTLVTGELSNSTLEIALQKIERSILNNMDYKLPKKKESDNIFNKTIP